MTNIDLIKIIGNISQTLAPIQAFISGLAYILGIFLFIAALKRLHTIGASGKSGGGGAIFIPIAFILGGSALIYLPSAIVTLSNSAFGVGNALQYVNYNSFNILSFTDILIRTAGLAWFVRGCVLLVHASEPGVKHGSKGLGFIVAGILAMNFQSTTAFINTVMDKLSLLH